MGRTPGQLASHAVDTLEVVKGLIKRLRHLEGIDGDTLGDMGRQAMARAIDNLRGAEDELWELIDYLSPQIAHELTERYQREGISPHSL